MAKNYLDHSTFNINEAEHTGGVTGSKKVQSEGVNYQLKPSIKDASLMRSVKAHDTDRENYGEVIAATVSRALTNSDTSVELVPQVSLVYDYKRQSTLIASKYLNNVEGTLDGFAEKQGVEVHGKHAKISAHGLASRDSLNISGSGKDNQLLREDLAKAIAISALSGDHDVNPGNMMVIRDSENRNRIARIDFGHAFNDLLNAPKMVGGVVRNKENQIMDFLNREEVAHIVSEERRESKLWRSYSGIIPSKELASAFKEIASSDRLQEGVNNSRQAFQELVTELAKDPEGNKKVLKHIKNSLIAINNNVSENKIDSSKVNTQQALDQTFQNLGDFYSKGQEQMKNVAKLMDMQVKIDQLITDKKEGKPLNQGLSYEVKNAYNELKDAPGIGIKGHGEDKGIEWIKNKSGKENPAFKGNLDEFIKQRSESLGVGSKGIDDLSATSIQVTNEHTAVAKFLKDSVGIYAKQGNPVNQESLKGQFDALIDTLPEKERASPMIVTIKENMGNYVANMDKQITKATDDILANKGAVQITPEAYQEARNEAALNSKYMKTSQDLQKDPEKLFENAVKDTAWKKAASICRAIGWEEGANKCEQRNDLSKAQNIAKKIGLDISKHINTQALTSAPPIRAPINAKKPEGLSR